MLPLEIGQGVSADCQSVTLAHDTRTLLVSKSEGIPAEGAKYQVFPLSNDMIGSPVLASWSNLGTPLSPPINAPLLIVYEYNCFVVASLAAEWRTVEIYAMSLLQARERFCHAALVPV
jgi:hypothetical protein